MMFSHRKQVELPKESKRQIPLRKLHSIEEDRPESFPRCLATLCAEEEACRSGEGPKGWIPVRPRARA